MTVRQVYKKYVKDIESSGLPRASFIQALRDYAKIKCEEQRELCASAILKKVSATIILDVQNTPSPSFE